MELKALPAASEIRQSLLLVSDPEELILCMAFSELCTRAGRFAPLVFSRHVALEVHTMSPEAAPKYGGLPTGAAPEQNSTTPCVHADISVPASSCAAGAPRCRCVLCHQEQHADAGEYLLAQRQITRTPEGVTNRGLGPLLLVRVSAISNAWVHMQCALWSGEVTSSHMLAPIPGGCKNPHSGRLLTVAGLCYQYCQPANGLQGTE